MFCKLYVIKTIIDSLYERNIIDIIVKNNVLWIISLSYQNFPIPLPLVDPMHCSKNFTLLSHLKQHLKDSPLSHRLKLKEIPTMSIPTPYDYY